MRSITIFPLLLLLVGGFQVYAIEPPPLPMMVQARSATGDTIILDEFQINGPLFNPSIYFEFVDIVEQNDMIYVVPHSIEPAIRQYDWKNREMVAKFHYPSDVQGTFPDIAWDYFLYPNGTLGFYSVNMGPEIEITIADHQSNNLGTYTLSSSIDRYSTGSLDGLDFYPNHFFCSFNADEEPMTNASVEVLAFDLISKNSSSFLVNKGFYIDDLSLHNGDLYAIMADDGFRFLVRANAGKWEKVLKVDDEYSDLDFWRYFWYNGSLITVKKQTTGWGFTITQWDPSSQAILGEYSFTAEAHSSDDYHKMWEEENVIINLIEFRQGNLVEFQANASHLVLDLYYQLVVFDGTSWTHKSLYPGENEHLINSFPYSSTWRLELLGVYVPLPNDTITTQRASFQLIFSLGILPLLILKRRNKSIE